MSGGSRGIGLAIALRAACDHDVVCDAVERTFERFGAVDIVVNNASAIDVSPSTTIAMKRYDLMQDVNTRGTFLLSRTCVPYLHDAPNPHVLTLSPPLSLDPRCTAATSPTRWRSSG